MAVQQIFTKRHAKSFRDREGACKAVQDLEFRLAKRDLLGSHPIRYVVSVCPESNRFVPVIVATPSIAHVSDLISEAGFPIVG